MNVAVDMIVQNPGADGTADISFTVLEDDLPKALAAVKKAADELGAEEVLHDASVQGVDRGAGDGDANRCGRPNVSRVGRCEYQYRGDHDQRDQGFGAR